MQRRVHYVPPRYQLDSRKALVVAGAAERHPRQRLVEIRYADREVEALYTELVAIANSRIPSHISKISEEIARVVFITESLAQKTLDRVETAVKIAHAAWEMNVRYFSFALDCRSEIDNDHRRILWIARIRCIGLASNHCLREVQKVAAEGSHIDSLQRARSEACARGVHRRDPQHRAAHETLWPYDTPDGALFQWCRRHELLPFAVRGDYDAAIRSASMHTLWRMIQLLRSQWVQLPYCGYLIAHVNRLVERIADLSSYCGGAAEFNHPVFYDLIDSADGSGKKDYMVNDRFLRETEYTFYAFDVRLYRCAYVNWPSTPRAPTQTAKFRPDALQRLEAFLTKQISEDRFIHFIEKDYRVVFYDHVLHPGEMELFELLRPYDDRVPMTCVAKLRQPDFDRFQRSFVLPPAREVWKRLTTSDEPEKMRSHPAYMLLASRILQYYFDSNFDGAVFDSYHCNIDFVPLIHLRDAEETALSRAIRRRAVTTGSAQHVLGGTLVTHGLRHTEDATYPHPIILQCVGQYAVVCHSNSRALSLPVDFPTAFLYWLREFVTDRRLAGTFTNGASCTALALEIDPFEDTAAIVVAANATRDEFDKQRAERTNIERAVDNMQAMLIEDAKAASKVVVFGTQEVVPLPENAPDE